jgi:hypothetical protein
MPLGCCFFSFSFGVVPVSREPVWLGHQLLRVHLRNMPGLCHNIVSSGPKSRCILFQVPRRLDGREDGLQLSKKLMGERLHFHHVL